MKQYLSLIKRLGILVILVFCFGFVLISNTSQSVRASICCEECEVPPGESDFLYCSNECGASSGTCFTACRNRVRSCWRHCDFDCGGGQGQLCGNGVVCPPGYFCIDGYNCIQ
jgi:hypothetical protein